MWEKLEARVSEMATCPACGHHQNPQNGLRCILCGNELATPMRVYRRTWKGDWEPVDDLDLTRALPAPPPVRYGPIVRRWALLVLLAAVPGGLLWGWSWKLQRQVAQEHVATLAYFDLGLGQFEPKLVASARPLTYGKIRIEGRTNLPDGTVLEAQVLRGGTVLARTYPVAVKDGQFTTGELSNRGRAFRTGDYDIKVLARFAPTAQSAEVFRVVGPKGKKLTGPLVVKTSEGPQVSLEGTVSLP